MVNQPQSRIIAKGMLRTNTPIQDYRSEYGFWLKREDLSCPYPGPPFSKTRGVYEHIRMRPETLIGVLDTFHSQAGHAVARACQVLGKECINYYPEYKYDPGYREPQARAIELGAKIHGLKAGMSAVLFHQAKKLCLAKDGYMMPNALKLEETVEETAKEVPRLNIKQVIIPISSGTIAAGVIRGFWQQYQVPEFILHLGYSRAHEKVLKYVEEKSGVSFQGARITLVDEKYQYKDRARDGPTPPWSCNPYYDLKAFRWWVAHRKNYTGDTLFWNVG